MIGKLSRVAAFEFRQVVYGLQSDRREFASRRDA